MRLLELSQGKIVDFNRYMACLQFLYGKKKSFYPPQLSELGSETCLYQTDKNRKREELLHVKKR